LNLRQFRRNSPDVNLTPLIDVVFLLLIFFMVSTTFDRDSEIPIVLPDASAEPVTVEDNPIEITIDEQGHYYLNKQLVINTQLVTLKRALKKIAGERKSPPLIISADANTSHQAVVRAMDAARQLGFVQISIATQHKAESPR